MVTLSMNFSRNNLSFCLDRSLAKGFGNRLGYIMQFRRSFGGVVFAVLVLPFVSSVSSSQSDEQCVVKGRVVDDAGVAVPGSLVALLPRQVIDGCLVDYRRTDAEGGFRIEATYSSPGSSECVLYVMTAYPTDAYVPITPPFSLVRNLGQSFVGVPVSARRRKEEVDLGDVRLQVRYGTVILIFQNQDGAPLLSEKVRRHSIWLRIRDTRGDIVSENALSAEELRRAKTGLTVALPEGRWQVEASLEADSMVWQPLESELIIRKANDGSRRTLKLRAIQSNPKRQLIDESPETARLRLAELNVPLTGLSLIERAEKGNIIAVQLLLSAGIDPNEKGTHNTTALIRAAARGFSEIVTVLLANGANVDAREDNGATALLAAAGTGNSACVKALLENKAEISASTIDGATPLMMAAANDKSENVKVLLAAGADVSLKDGPGRTALTWARQADHIDIAELLKRAGATN